MAAITQSSSEAGVNSESPVLACVKAVPTDIRGMYIHRGDQACGEGIIVSPLNSFPQLRTLGRNSDTAGFLARIPGIKY
jgi:hypothetical protein